MSYVEDGIERAEFILARYAEEKVRIEQWPDALDPPPNGKYWIDDRGQPIYEPRQTALADLAARREVVELCLHVLIDKDRKDEHGVLFSDPITRRRASDILKILVEPYANFGAWRS